ncbi:MAG TPA: DotU family type IV/VI secretion system protein [Chthoniobacter sp.]|nr:DotU family type IV/VI secretion system protein [Chthoniobacter sp.]
MTLLELTEPLFQYLCMLNRIARNPGGENIGLDALRPLIVDMMAGMKEQAEKEPRLASQYNKMELPLIFFVDSMLAESKLTLAAQWHKNRMAYERKELAGDEKFFDLLEETLAEKGSEADERLEVYYACLGLGFQGWYAGQPEFLRKKMHEISIRISRVLDQDQRSRICPEAYQHMDGRDLIERPGLKLITIGVAVAGLCLLVLMVNFFLFHTASQGLANALREILRHDLWLTK